MGLALRARLLCAWTWQRVLASVRAWGLRHVANGSQLSRIAWLRRELCAKQSGSCRDVCETAFRKTAPGDVLLRM